MIKNALGAPRLKMALHLIALAGSTVLGVILVVQIPVLVYTYIDTYRLPPPPFLMPGNHRFPVYRVVSDLRDVGLNVFGFVCCLMLYFRFAGAEKENSKQPIA
jgi:hypothetical protein